MLLPVLFFVGTTPVEATTYYLSARGNNTQTGRSVLSPWATLAQLDSLRLFPGDQVLLRGGDTFRGRLRLDEADQGAPGLPIVIGSYGRGRARITAPENGILVENVAHITIRDLILESTARKSTSGSGIAFINTLPSNAKLSDIIVENVRVRGFSQHGVLVAGQARDSSKSGFNNVKITRVEASGNGHTGIRVTGHWDEASKLYANHNVYIGQSRAYNNVGFLGYWNHSGSGIFIEDVDGALIEHNVAFGNGKLSDSAAGGPIGIWAAVATNVVIQHNLSYSNRSKQLDGGGFDLDGGTTNSVMQYNRSYDNDGAGFLLYTYKGAPHRFTNNVVRCNISENDGRNPSYGGITVGGNADGPLTITDNHVVIKPSQRGMPAALKSSSRHVYATRNRFVTLRGAVLVAASSGTVLTENTYHSRGGTSNFVWDGITYESFEAWQAASGQEASTAGTMWKWSDRCSATPPGRGRFDAKP